MNLYFRLILVFFRSLFHLGTAGMFDVSTLRFRVLPTDLDTNLHMSNSIYLSIMDLSRLDLITRLGFVKHVFLSGWQPMIGNAYVRFRRGLTPFRAYEVESKLVSWDEKWVYIEQKFVSRGKTVAQGYVKGLFCIKGKPIPISQVIETMGWEVEDPPHPSWVDHMNALDDSVSQMNSETNLPNLHTVN